VKTQRLLITLTAAAAMTFIAGCDNKPSDPGTGATNAASTAAKEATKAVEAAPAVADKAVAEVKAAVTPAANDTIAKVNGVIDQAKALIGQNKYTEALTSLQSLAGTTLTADQEKIVAGLKEQIQKAIAAKTGTDAANAVGNLLKK
jgi:hypothetical protein